MELDRVVRLWRSHNMTWNNQKFETYSVCIVLFKRIRDFYPTFKKRHGNLLRTTTSAVLLCFLKRHLRHFLLTSLNFYRLVTDKKKKEILLTFSFFYLFTFLKGKGVRNRAPLLPVFFHVFFLPLSLFRVTCL